MNDQQQSPNLDDGDDEPKANEAKEAARGRQGDQARPTCPNCTKPKKRPVYLVAASTRSLFTWYSCPTEGCGYRIKVPRPNIQEVLGRQRLDEDFSTR